MKKVVISLLDSELSNTYISRTEWLEFFQKYKVHSKIKALSTRFCSLHQL